MRDGNGEETCLEIDNYKDLNWIKRLHNKKGKSRKRIADFYSG